MNSYKKLLLLTTIVINSQGNLYSAAELSLKESIGYPSNDKGESLAHVAVKTKNIAMMSSLVECHTPLDSQDLEGNTALHVAIAQLNNDRDCDILDDDRDPFTTIRKSKPSLAMISILIDGQAKKAIKNNENKTPLELFKYGQTYPDVVSSLTEGNANTIRTQDTGILKFCTIS